MIKVSEYNDWDEPTYQSWFNTYGAKDWFDVSAEAVTVMFIAEMAKIGLKNYLSNINFIRNEQKEVTIQIKSNCLSIGN